MKLKLLILGLVLSVSGQVLACSCAEWGSAKEMLRETEFAYLVVPTEDSKFRTVTENWDGERFDITMARTGMKVVKRFKGKYKKFFYLESEKGDGANCGVHFKKYDGLHLVFGGRGPNGYYTTSGCDMGTVLPDYDDENTDWEDPVQKFLKEVEKL